MTSQIKVLIDFADLLLRIQHWVSCGYFYHHRITVPVGKLYAVGQDWGGLGVFASRKQRALKKAAGLANTAFLVYCNPDADKADCYLLVTEGRSMARQLYTFKDAREGDQRLRSFQYELVQLTMNRDKYGKYRKGVGGRQSAAQPDKSEGEIPQAGKGRKHRKLDKTPEVQPGKSSGKPSWTWRLTVKAEEGFREQLIQSVRSKSYPAIQTVVRDLYNIIGFGGARRQLGKLVALLRAEVKRHFGDNQKVCEIPKFHPFQKKRKVLELSISQLKDMQEKRRRITGAQLEKVAAEVIVPMPDSSRLGLEKSETA